MAPGSSPPCPGSMAMVSRRHGRRGRAIAAVAPGQGGDGVVVFGRARHRRAARGDKALLLVFGRAHQLHQRVGRVARVQVEHQPVAVTRDRQQREHLRVDALLQVEHQPHHARPVLAHAHLADVRIVRRDLGDQFAQRRVQVQPVDIDHEAVRLHHQMVRRRQRRIRLNGHARVILRGPHPHRHDVGATRDLRPGQAQDDGAGTGAGHAREPLPARLAGQMGIIRLVGRQVLDQHGGRICNN